MAKITITIEDKVTSKGKRVDVKCDPSLDQMQRMITSGHQMEASHSYAQAMLNRAYELGGAGKAKRHMEPLTIIMPKKPGIIV
jgi:hypothetical protein